MIGDWCGVPRWVRVGWSVSGLRVDFRNTKADNNLFTSDFQPHCNPQGNATTVPFTGKPTKPRTKPAESTSTMRVNAPSLVALRSTL